MYARCVSVKLTPKGKAEFTSKLEAEIIPLLRKQKGFQDEITFITPAAQRGLGREPLGQQGQRGDLPSRCLRRSDQDSYRSWSREPRRLKPTKLPTPPCTRSALLSRRRKVSR